eukprot:s1238_g2.t1
MNLPRAGAYCPGAIQNGPISLAQAQVLCGSGPELSFPKAMMIGRPRPRVMKGLSKPRVVEGHSKAAVAAGARIMKGLSKPRVGEGRSKAGVLLVLWRSIWQCEEARVQEPTSSWGPASLRLALRRI